MECIRLFNTELQSLYETPPPISKAKMASITRTAMKSIKFYKHVVQSVEKFIQKCKMEYKIPGLYVIDSIVRQSRHQFGAEKDVFAPRFARNMETTFAHLFKCPPEDKSKIIRVLNLWQKNNVFPPETIQPIFDLANPDHPLHQTTAVESASMNNSMDHDSSLLGPGDDSLHAGHSGAQDNKQLDQNTIRQLQQFQQMLIRQTSETATMGKEVKFNKNLLDFDYGEDEEDHASSPRTSNILADPKNLSQLLSDPNVIKHLQNIQMLKQNEMENQKNTKLTEMREREEKFEKHLATVLKKLPFASECDLSKQPPNDYQMPGQASSNPYVNLNTLQYVQMQAESVNMGAPPDPEVEFVSSNDKDEVINLDANESRSSSPRHDRYRRRRSRSRSRDRNKRDRRRRSFSRSRSRSRSPRRSRRSREKEREHERERKRKGLPDIKKEHLSVCSTTLWVGHLSKLAQQEELSDTFGKYGDIVSIDMIPPRGCAFIVMHRRQDAHKCMQALKGYKVLNKVITVSWAAGKGVKSKEWKDYWDIDLGVSYIPWNKLSKSTDFAALEEGGMFDDETMPSWMKEKLKEQPVKKEEEQNVTIAPGIVFTAPPIDTSQPPPTAAPIIPGVQMVPQFPLGPVPRLMTPMGIPIAPVSMLNVPPPQMMMSAAAPPGLVPGLPPPMNPFSAPPPTIFSAAVHPPAMSSNNDDHMDIEEDEAPNAPKMGLQDGNNIVITPSVFNQPPPTLSNDNKKDSNDDRKHSHKDSDNRRSSDRDSYRRDSRERSSHRWNSSERESNYDRGDRRRQPRSSERTDRRNDREKPLQDRLRDLAGMENKGGNGGGRNSYEREYNPRDNRQRYNEGSHHQGMQRNDYNRMEEGYDRRNFGGNRFSMPIRGGPMGRGGANQFGPRMPPHFVRGPRPGFQRFPMYNEERGPRGGMEQRGRMDQRGMENRGRRNWNDHNNDQDENPRSEDQMFSRRRGPRDNNGSEEREERYEPPPRRDISEVQDEETWDEEIEMRWKENEKQNENPEDPPQNTSQNETQIDTHVNEPTEQNHNDYDEPEPRQEETQDTSNYVEQDNTADTENMMNTNTVDFVENNEPSCTENEFSENADGPTTESTDNQGATTPLCDE